MAKRRNRLDSVIDESSVVARDLMPPGLYLRRAPVPDHPLWQQWDAIHRILPLWWFLGAAMFKVGWRRTGFDSIRTLRTEPRVIRVMAMLNSMDIAILDRLIDLAKINADRQAYFARSILLAYITIPFTLGAIIAELAADALKQTFIDYAPSWGGALAGIGIAVILRLIFDAQARQLVLILDTARIERGMTTIPVTLEIVNDGGAADGVG